MAPFAAMHDLPHLIPLFPLPDAVLFPQAPLPLHIFEPRYRKMVADALQSHRTVGMTLLRPGWESDYAGRPPIYPLGCAGRIERWDALPDGRFDVVLRGVSRFRVLAERGGEPYRLASIEPLPDLPGEPAELDQARKAVLEEVGRAADGPAVLVLQPNLPHDVFVNTLCQALPLAALERQSLLECDGLLERCRKLVEILQFKRLEQSWGSAGDPRVH